MRFTVEQTLPGPIDRVLDALLDPDFVARLGDLPNLAPPVVLDQERDGDGVVQLVQHRFIGSLPSAVTRVVDPAKLTWVAETVYDLARGRASFRILPDHYAGKLRCSGTHTFTASGDSTRRVTAGELAVSVPLVGRVVERAIVSGLRSHLDGECELLASWLEVKP